MFFSPRYSSTPLSLFFFFNDTATTEIYTLSLHDALPIYQRRRGLPPEFELPRADRRAGNAQQPFPQKIHLPWVPGSLHLYWQNSTIRHGPIFATQVSTHTIKRSLILQARMRQVWAFACNPSVNRW